VFLLKINFIKTTRNIVKNQENQIFSKPENKIHILQLYLHYNLHLQFTFTFTITFTITKKITFIYIFNIIFIPKHGI
jgi:hypothetical protein